MNDLQARQSQDSGQATLGDWAWTALAWPYICAVTVPCAVWTIFSTLLGAERWYHWAVRPWARLVHWVMGVTTVTVVGAEHLRNRGVLIMANHQSHLDPPLLLAISPEPVRFLAKRSLFFIPFFGQALWASGQIPIARAHRDKAFASIDLVAAEISSGKSVIVFPEGTRACREQMGPFKRGGFVIAARGGLPILPIGIAGTRSSWAPGSGLFRRGPIVVVVGEPIDTRPYGVADKEALMQRVRSRIDELRVQAQSARG